MDWKMTPKFLLATVIVASLLIAIRAFSSGGATKGRFLGAPNKGALSLEVGFDKPRYRLGEPMVLTITLRNSGKTAVWISKPAGLVRFPGGFQVAIFDQDGRQLPVRIGVIDSFGEDRKRPPSRARAVELVTRGRFIFLPGDFFGFRRTLTEAGGEIKSPGRYRIQASYYDVFPIEDESQLRMLGEELKVPVWTGELRSTPVYIDVE